MNVGSNNYTPRKEKSDKIEMHQGNKWRYFPHFKAIITDTLLLWYNKTMIGLSKHTIRRMIKKSMNFQILI